MNKKAIISVSLAAGMLLGMGAAPAISRIESRQGLTAAAATATTTDGWTISYDDTHCEITGCTSDVRGAVSMPAEVDVNGTKLPVTKLTNSFYYSGSKRDFITSLTIPASITTIESSVFWQMKNVESVDVQAKIMILPSSMFSSCTNLEKVTLPDGLMEIGQNAFYGCLRLKEVRLPDTVKTLGSSVFQNCESLEKVNIPGGVAVIPESAFKGCSNLKSVAIGEGVMSLSYYAFQDCKMLEELVFPKSMTKVTSPLMFSGCNNLKSLTFENPECEISYIEGTEEKPLTIYGYEGSTAQKYCEKNGERMHVVFKSIGEKPAPEPVQDTGLFCDANGNGEIDVADAQFVLTYYVEQMAGNSPSWYEITKNPKAPDAP
ncbi:MAG: leucine-rich repeat protein [Oscillospiraceae bacterium]|nr:leucine-rich repeat protein [Oscillospiraceae bacterium]